MTNLNLSGNNIGHIGALDLGVAVKVNSTLTKLDFNRTQFGDLGTRALDQEFKFNTIMRAIKIHNEISLVIFND